MRNPEGDVIDPRSRCIRASLDHVASNPLHADRAARSVGLLRFILESMPRLEGLNLYANVVGAQACFVRAYRELTAAQDLAYHGHYASIAPLLRAAYEAGLLARHLAKAPETADEWLSRGAWVPPGGTRRWMRESNFLGLSDADQQTYTDNYVALSAVTHPSAQACLPLFRPDEQETCLDMILDSEFDSETFDNALQSILATALFCCFAVRNAAAHPMHLDPEWLRAVSDLAEQVAGQPLPHLHRNWGQEGENFRRLMEMVHDIAGMDDALSASPLSSKNLQRRVSQNLNEGDGKD